MELEIVLGEKYICLHGLSHLVTALLVHVATTQLYCTVVFRLRLRQSADRRVQQEDSPGLGTTPYLSFAPLINLATSRRKGKQGQRRTGFFCPAGERIRCSIPDREPEREDQVRTNGAEWRTH